MWFWLFFWLATDDTRSAAKRRKAFVEFFNRPDVRVCEGEEHEYFAAYAQQAVLAELAQPASAAFDPMHIRFCPDNLVRAAGVVRVSGRGGEVTGSWFWVELPSGGQPVLLELSYKCPITLWSPTKPAQWAGGVIPYQSSKG